MNEIAKIEDRQNDVAQAVMPTDTMSMIFQAVSKGASPEMIGQLIEFKERIDKAEARKQFDIAFSAAKAAIRTVKKRRKVDYTTNKGRTNYDYESLADVQEAIEEAFSANGLSYRFRTISEPNQPISVTCIIAHRDGHFEENTLSGPRDESGNKNTLQSIASTVTYLQRYTLKAAAGLATDADDDDGAASDNPYITDEQADELTRIIEETGADKVRFLRYVKVSNVAEIRAADFENSKTMLLAAYRQRQEVAR